MSSPKSRTRRPAPKIPASKTPAPKPPPKRSINGAYVGLAIAAVVVVIALVAVLVTRSSGDNGDAGAQTYPVQVTGPALATLPDKPAADPALGQPAPTLTGQLLFGGSALTITPGGGTPKLLVFVAHWCPHCQREVPVLVKWIASGQKPANLDVVAVSTANDLSDQNSPASAWFQREQWPTPVLADSSDNKAAQAYGLPGYPYLVVLGPDGTVEARTSGELTQDQITSFVTQALA